MGDQKDLGKSNVKYSHEVPLSRTRNENVWSIDEDSRGMFMVLLRRFSSERERYRLAF